MNLYCKQFPTLHLLSKFLSNTAMVKTLSEFRKRIQEVNPRKNTDSVQPEEALSTKHCCKSDMYSAFLHKQAPPLKSIFPCVQISFHPTYSTLDASSIYYLLSCTGNMNLYLVFILSPNSPSNSIFFSITLPPCHFYCKVFLDSFMY